MEKAKFTIEECSSFFDRLFLAGFTGKGVKEEIVPGGWGNSPYKFIFHPTPEQQLEEHRNLKRNIEMLSGGKKNRKRKGDEPNFEAFQKGRLTQRYSDADKELTELVGMCVWDIFSNNHEVIAPDGRVVELGSARSSGGFIADWINELQKNEGFYDYMDFYYGTKLVAHRADLTPVYKMIFRRLYNNGCNWIYHYPRLYLIRTKKPKNPEVDPAKYNPNQAILNELKVQENEERFNEMAEWVEKMNREAIEEAAQSDPPQIVNAYVEIYGSLPQGWPPVS